MHRIFIALYFVINDLLLKHGILEFIYLRSRPYLAYPNDIIARGQEFRDSSFPSGHMAIVSGAMFIFSYYFRKYWSLGLGFVLLIAFERMHNGMHYPLDVLVGIILGILYGLLAIWISKKIFPFRKTS